MPLCTTAMVPAAFVWGWAFLSLGAPWVAHLVCPMPEQPGRVSPPLVMFSRTFSLPMAFFVRSFSPSKIAIPAESYPLYSSFDSPSKMMEAACSFPIYPTIPHIYFDSFLFQFCYIPIILVNAFNCR